MGGIDTGGVKYEINLADNVEDGHTWVERRATEAGLASASLSRRDVASPRSRPSALNTTGGSCKWSPA